MKVLKTMRRRREGGMLDAWPFEVRLNDNSNRPYWAPVAGWVDSYRIRSRRHGERVQGELVEIDENNHLAC